MDGVFLGFHFADRFVYRGEFVIGCAQLGDHREFDRRHGCAFQVTTVHMHRQLQAYAERATLEHVNTIVLRRGVDGKDYPARPLSRTERNQARSIAHQLVHRDHLSIRRAQRVMAVNYGVRRSVGTIARDLAGFECDHCAGVDT